MRSLLNEWCKIIGFALTMGNLLCVMNSMYYFLVKAGFPVDAWLFFNACAPSQALFAIGFFSRNKGIMAASVPFLIFFGGGGLFVFGWSGPMIFAQISHILMVLAVFYIFFLVVGEREWKLPLGSALAGLMVFALVMPIQQAFVKDHPEYLKKLNDPSFESFVKNKKRD